MTALEIYKAQYEEEKTRTDQPYSKYHWAAINIFGLVTDDSSLDELFVMDILEVCKIILEKRNYEYIKNENNYVKYILVCQLLKNWGWINWGTSIRGAWCEASYFDIPKNILDELEWWDPEHHVVEEVPFTVENLKDLINFMTEEESDPISEDILKNLAKWRKELEE